MFGSQKITQVATQVQPLFGEENEGTDWLRESILRAIMSNSDIPEALMEGLAGSTPNKVRQFYKWAEKHYVHGLADSSIVANTDNTGLMQDVLAQQLGVPVEIEYCFMDRINNVHVGWEKLANEYGFDFATNEIKKLSQEIGYPVYLKDMLAVHPTVEVKAPQYDPTGGRARRGQTPDEQATLIYGLSEFRQAGGVIQEDRTTEAVRVVAVYVVPVPSEIPEGAVTYTTHVIERTWELTGYSEDDQYHQVMYRYRKNNATRYGWWTYRDGAGTYPTLDNTFDTYYRNPGTFFPFLFFRMDKQNLTEGAHKESQAYKDTEKLFSILGLDYQDISDSIHESPDIDDVEQAALMFGIPMNSKEPEGIRYLFEFFRRQAVTKPSALYLLPGQRTESEAIIIQDSRFKLGLGYKQVTWEKTAGRIGAPGAVSASESFTMVPVYYERTVYVGEGEYRPEKGVEERALHTWVYKKQINDVFYEEVRVVDTSLTFYISGRYGTVARGENDNLLIPLDMSLCELLSEREQEQLFLQAMHLVFNAKVVTKLKWYQTSLFKMVITVAAIAIAVSTGQAQFATWASAFAAGGMQALAMAVLVSVVKMAAFNAVFSKAVKELGMENALILAAVVMVVSAYKGMPSGSVKGAPWADDLMKLASGLAKAVSTEASALVSEYNAKTSAFNLMAEQKWEELEEVSKLLDTAGLLDPFTFVGHRPITILGESPESFYNRTIHAGNIGTNAYDAIEFFVDNSLKLPEPHETLRGTYDPYVY